MLTPTLRQYEFNMNNYNNNLLGDDDIKLLISNDTHHIGQLVLGTISFLSIDRNNITNIGINYLKYGTWNKLNSISLSFNRII